MTRGLVKGRCSRERAGRDRDWVLTQGSQIAMAQAVRPRQGVMDATIAGSIVGSAGHLCTGMLMRGLCGE
jgi:hypothetical protein